MIRFDHHPAELLVGEHRRTSGGGRATWARSVPWRHIGTAVAVTFAVAVLTGISPVSA